MYKVVIVDDEHWILEGIKMTFHWMECGFEVVFYSTNPMETLDFILKNSPEAVFTDIRMPGISGLELIQKAKEQGSKSEFIVISGHSDFNYAVEAMRLGAFDYILKPLEEETANNILKKLKKHLDASTLSIVTEETDKFETYHASDNFHGIFEYINENYMKDIALQNIAKMFYLNFTYCSSQFKKITGKSFSEYLTEVRMKKAYQLIKQNAVKPVDACFQVGYNDYYYFNKVFKKYFGYSPTKVN